MESYGVINNILHHVAFERIIQYLAVLDFIEEWQIINSTTRSVAYTKLGSMNWALTRD